MRLREPSSNQAGFSLIELVVALSVMLIILAAVCSMMASAIKSSAATYELTEAQESLRTAQEYINRDLTVAGDGLRSIRNVVVPTGFVQTWLVQNIVNPTNGTVVLPMISSDNGVPGATVIAGTNPAVNVLDQTDRIVLLAQEKPSDPTAFGTPVSLDLNAITLSNPNSIIQITAADINRFRVGEIYFLTSATGGAFVTITAVNTATNQLTIAAGDTYGLNQTVANSALRTVCKADLTGGLPLKNTQAVSLTRMRIITYFVRADGLLIRRIYGVPQAGFTDSIIAEHLAPLDTNGTSGLQFRYILSLRDASGNLLPPAQQLVQQLTTTNQQAAVEQVEVTVRTATVHPINGKSATISQTTRAGIRNLQFQQGLQRNDAPGL